MRSNSFSLKITCDGGAATGKSTGAKLIAKKYKLAFLSSGLLYRYASYLILKHKPKNNILLNLKKNRVGNGGFSLRSKKLHNLTKNYKYDDEKIFNIFNRDAA